MLITGATGGIGAALARRYAEPERTLILHGRDGARLAALARDCEARGARVARAGLSAAQNDRVSVAFEWREPGDGFGAAAIDADH